jgi:hypothetical protein
MSDSPEKLSGGLRPAPAWLAVQVGLVGVSADLIAQLYHDQPSLQYLRLTLAPALTAGAVAAVSFLVLLRLYWGFLGAERGRSIGVQAGIALTAGILVAAIEFLETRPYLYLHLPRLLTLGNLAVAVAGHLLLSLRLTEEGRGRRFLIATTAATYLATAVNLAVWFYYVLLEERFGPGAVQWMERGAVGFGAVAFVSGLTLLAGESAFRIAGSRFIGVASRLLFIPLPYAALTLAVWLWMGKLGADADIPAGVRRLLWCAPALLALALLAAAIQRGGRGLRLPATGALILAGIGCFVVFRADLGDRLGLARYREENRELRHIILVTSDTLRADVLEAYGGAEIRTPRLNELAEASIVFDEPLAPSPWTLPSFAAIFTGLMPGAFGGIEINWRLGWEPPTLADRLAEAGYYTAAIGLNPLLLPRHGLDRGFATYEFYPRERRARTLGGRVLALAAPDFFRTEPTSEDLTEMGLAWLKRHREKDFFFWLHYYDPHTPLGPPEPFRPKGEGPRTIVEPWERSLDIKQGHYVPNAEEREWLRQLYLGEVRYVDHCVGLLMDGLRELGLYEDALIIFASDHGEEFWDHGKYGHGQSLYHELIHVPLMVKLPGESYRGRVAQPVSIASIMPTILDFAGVELRRGPIVGAVAGAVHAVDGRIGGDGTGLQRDLTAVVFAAPAGGAVRGLQVYRGAARER